jgi:predicted nucleic acid-binding protein
MPADKVFIDTNVILYLHDARNNEKKAVAIEWMRRLAARDRATINLQSLNEVSNAFLKKRWFTSSATAFEIVDGLSEFGDAPLGLAEVQMARLLHKSLGYSWWDCLLLASALELGCSHFLSEDLHDGQQIGDLMIINPFLHTPAEILGPFQD